jgi:putative transcriptional regulator
LTSGGQAGSIGCALGLSQQELSARFGIPLDALRDWEQSREDPDAAARAYLLVIARNPKAVSEALRATL